MKFKRPIIQYALMTLIIFQGLSGIVGGVGLILDPSGKMLQIPLQWLTHSPFNDYMIPGIILLIILGFFPLIVFYGLIKNLKWSWFASLILGIALLIWITVEILIIGYHSDPPLQLTYGVVGLLILILVLLIPGQTKKSNNI